jgi:subtilisin family serine protease
MKKVFWVLILGLGFFITLSLLRAPSSSQESITQQYVPNEVLVKFKPEAGKQKALTALDVLKPRVVNYLGQEIAFSDWNPEVRAKSSFLGDPYLIHLRVPEAIGTEKAIVILKNNPNVEYAEPNYILKLDSIPNDAYFQLQWGLHNTGQTGGKVDADVDAPEGWDIFTGTQNIIIAIIDTGIDYGHPDLVNNIWKNPGETGDNKEQDGIDNDNNGYIDDWHGWNFNTGVSGSIGNNDPMDLGEYVKMWNNPNIDPQERLKALYFVCYKYHGTHVAGIGGASGNNGVGVSGICWNVSLMPLKIFIGTEKSDEPESFVSYAVRAIDYAITNGAKIINASWGFNENSASLLSAIGRAQANGVLFVASAGNDNKNNDDFPHYPASYDLDNIISVLATDHNDERWVETDLKHGSNYGIYSVDFAAPGTAILSTRHTICTNQPIGGNYYEYKTGTSMACPYVAGLAALVWGYRPYLNWWQIKTIIGKSVDKISNLASVTRYSGRINAYKALTYPTPILPDPPSRLNALVYKRTDGFYDIKLTWIDNSNNEEGFIIYRNSGSAFFEADRVGPNTTEYWDYELPSGYYYYYIRAFNQDGESIKTPQVAAKAF